MDWKHIRQAQPENDRQIVQIDPPCGGHYCMGMRHYFSQVAMSWDEMIEQMEKCGYPLPDYWWVYAEDFPFPDKQISKMETK